MPHLHHAALGTSRLVFLTLILGFTTLVYLREWLSLRSSRMERISAWQAISFVVGLFLIWTAVVSPFAALDHELLTVHMLKHLLLMTLAPPLIWLGAPVCPLLHGLPRRFVDRLLVRLCQSQVGKTFAEIMGRPEFPWLAASAALVGWHIPEFFALGMRSAQWHLFEQSSFLVTGLLFWRPIVRPSEGASKQDFSMILYLFCATLPCDILSGFLAFSDRVVYPIYFSSPHLFGLSPLEDQECAAALMWTCITIVYFVAGAILTTHLLSPQGASQVVCVESKWSGAAIPRRVSQSLEAL